MKRKQSIIKTLALGLALVGVWACQPTFSVHAHKAYNVFITMDTDNFRYVPIVTHGDEHVTKALGGNFGLGTEASTSGRNPTLDNYLKADVNSTPEEWENIFHSSDAHQVWTFPSLDGMVMFGLGNAFNATGEDEQLAQAIANTVVPGLNDAIGFVIGSNKPSTESEFAQLAAKIANAASKATGQNTSTIEWRGTEYTFAVGLSAGVKVGSGLEATDYITISTGAEGSERKLSVPYKMRKGYYASDIANIKRSGVASDVNYVRALAGVDVEYINWKHVVVQGNYAAQAKGITYANSDEVAKPGALESAIASMLSNIVNGLNSILGLRTIPDLILNQGIRASAYYKGAMPYGWMQSAQVLYALTSIMAWGMLSFSFVRLLFKRQLQTMNIGERISLLEGAKNLILTAFMLGTFGLIFGVVMDLNQELVSVFAQTSKYVSNFGLTTAGVGGGMLSQVLISIAYFALGIWFNFVYVLRGITIAILFGIAPLAIYAFSLGGKYSQIFSTFWKELISNIFVQSFHALLAAFFMNAMGASTLQTFEVLIVFMAFIPLTNFIKGNILGLSNGIMDSANGMKAMAMGIGGMALGAGVGVAASSGGALAKSWAEKRVGSSDGAGGGGTGRSGANPKAQSAMQTQNQPVGKGSNGEVGKGGEVSNAELMKDMTGNLNTDSTSVSLSSNPSMGREKSGLIDAAKDKLAQAIVHPGTGSAMQSLGNMGKSIMNAGLAVGDIAVEDKASSVGHIHSSKQQLQNAGAYATESRQARSAYNQSVANQGAHGIQEVFDSGNSETVVYAGSKGGGGSAVMNDKRFGASDEGRTVVDVVDAFQGKGQYEGQELKQEAAMKYYKSQGINGGGYVGGKPAINFQKNSRYTAETIGQMNSFDKARDSQAPDMRAEIME